MQAYYNQSNKVISFLFGGRRQQQEEKEKEVSRGCQRVPAERVRRKTAKNGTSKNVRFFIFFKARRSDRS